MKAFNEESFSHQGKHYQIPPDVPYRGYQLKDITLVPRPLNRPVDIWQPVTSGRTIDFIARKGIKGMTALSGEKIVEQFFGEYRRVAGEAGRDLKLGQDMALGFGFFLGDTVEEAVERVRPFHDGTLQVVRALRPRPLRGRAGPYVGFPRRTRADAPPWRTASSRRRGFAARPRSSSRPSASWKRSTPDSRTSYSSGPKVCPGMSSAASWKSSPAKSCPRLQGVNAAQETAIKLWKPYVADGCQEGIREIPSPSGRGLG